MVDEVFMDEIIDSMDWERLEQDLEIRCRCCNKDDDTDCCSIFWQCNKEIIKSFITQLLDKAQSEKADIVNNLIEEAKKQAIIEYDKEIDEAFLPFHKDLEDFMQTYNIVREKALEKFGLK